MTLPALDVGSAAPSVGWLRAAQRLALDDALAEVGHCLAQRSVRLLLIKGPSFAWWLYDDPRERPYGDIDLLVDPESFETARGGLAGLGFVPLQTSTNRHEIASHHEVWVRRTAAPAKVELHHTLFSVPASAALVWQRLTEGARSIAVAGARIDIPSDTACALIAGLHAAQHGVGEPRPMRDLRRALQRVETQTWQAAAALAQELGAGPAFAVGLRLDPHGRELADRLGLGAVRPSRSIRLLASSPPDTAMGVERLITTRGTGARLRLLIQELRPSPEFMRLCYPLARRGNWGLALAYLWRPVELARKLPRGVWAWLQAEARPRHTGVSSESRGLRRERSRRV